MKESLIEKYHRWVKIDKSNLSEELSRNSSLLFQIGIKKIQAQKKMERAKRLVSRTAAIIDKEVRAKGERVTEKQMESIKERSSKVKNAHSDFLDAQEDFGIYSITFSSMLDKSQCLTNLAHNYRKEMDYGIVKKTKELDEKSKMANIKRGK